MKKTVFAFMAALMLLPSGVQARSKGPSSLKVISYNIRLGTANDGTNSWNLRYPASALMINDQKPDIFGLQEAFDFQKDYLDEACKGYSCVGVGRDDGKAKGEQMAIFYNTKRIKLRKWGTFWLSETPDTPSKGWDAACFRTATWALLKDKKSGKEFYYVNTHLDHIGKEARLKGLALIVDRIKDINPEGYPMVLTGDFNVRMDDPCLKALEGKMVSAREIAVKTDHHITYNGWGSVKDPATIIDYIYYTGFSACTVYETITKPYYDRTYISDHYPITATLVF